MASLCGTTAPAAAEAAAPWLAALPLSGVERLLPVLTRRAASTEVAERLATAEAARLAAAQASTDMRCGRVEELLGRSCDACAEYPAILASSAAEALENRQTQHAEARHHPPPPPAAPCPPEDAPSPISPPSPITSLRLAASPPIASPSPSRLNTDRLYHHRLASAPRLCAASAATDRWRNCPLRASPPMRRLATCTACHGPRRRQSGRNGGQGCSGATRMAPRREMWSRTRSSAKRSSVLAGRSSA